MSLRSLKNHGTEVIIDKKTILRSDFVEDFVR